jgi:hypothetical protein
MVPVTKIWSLAPKAQLKISKAWRGGNEVTIANRNLNETAVGLELEDQEKIHEEFSGILQGMFIQIW